MKQRERIWGLVRSPKLVWDVLALLEILRAVRKHDIAILLSTNGQNLNDERIIEALTREPPTHLIVAIDGLTVMRRGGEFGTTFCGLWRHFADCIYQDKRSECTPEDGKHAVRIALAARESASKGHAVQIAVCDIYG